MKLCYTFEKRACIWLYRKTLILLEKIGTIMDAADGDWKVIAMKQVEQGKIDVVIVGTGAAGFYCALQLPESTNILMITKENVEHSDSFLAQGGICVLKDEDDYDS